MSQHVRGGHRGRWPRLTDTDRNSAYNYWSIDQEPHSNADAVILKAGYLVRTANVDGSTLALTGDVNATTSLEILGGTPSDLSELTFNGKSLEFETSKEGVVTADIGFSKPDIEIPDLSKLKWKYVDSLPEIQSTYNDSAWKAADLNKTYNSHRALNTPMSLYGSDYGFNTGFLVFRGKFKATGGEKSFFIITQGGTAYGSSVWLDDEFLGSWKGTRSNAYANSTLTLPSLTAGKTYTITVVVDNQGLDENLTVGQDVTKNPRGIMDYDLDGHGKSDVSWKITGNLGGEDYVDKSRGPLNEGGLYIERQGLHLPGALSANADWKDSAGPVADGISKPGIGFFGAEFDLDLPSGWDIPLSFSFTNSNIYIVVRSLLKLFSIAENWHFSIIEISIVFKLLDICHFSVKNAVAYVRYRNRIFRNRWSSYSSIIWISCTWVCLSTSEERIISCRCNYINTSFFRNIHRTN